MDSDFAVKNGYGLGSYQSGSPAGGGSYAGVAIQLFTQLFRILSMSIQAVEVIPKNISLVLMRAFVGLIAVPADIVGYAGNVKPGGACFLRR